MHTFFSKTYTPKNISTTSSEYSDNDIEESNNERDSAIFRPLIQTTNKSPTQVENDKTLLENYWYNIFMTVCQDLPQSIATANVMATTGLQDDPDNPTGVSLPGYLNLIPQIGNTIAGMAAAYETAGLITTCCVDPTQEKILKSFLYSVFSISTILNGLTNIAMIFLNIKDESFLKFAMLTTYFALSANFIILCQEEMKLLHNIYKKNDESETPLEKKYFHLICSINLNVSIITSLLATTKMANRNIGAYGYLWGTWFGQAPELIEPTKKRVSAYCLGTP